MRIYQYDANGYATGVTREQSERDPIPPGWTHKPPSGIGGERYVGNVWQVVPLPPKPIPAQITRRQAKQQLAIDGLLSGVQPAIDAIPDELERTLVQIYWDDAADFERSHPQLMSLGEALGLTAEKIDTMFLSAATL